MSVIPYATPASLALVWSGDTLRIGFILAALAAAAVLAWVALHDRRRRVPRMAPARFVSRPDHAQFPGAAA